MAILANGTGVNLLKGEVEIDESYMFKNHKGKRGQSAFNEVSVFGILERDGVVKVVYNLKAETLLNETA